MTIVTQASDPILWAALNSSYISQGNPGVVVRGGQMYEVYFTTVEEIAFKSVENLDYIDSRSIHNSKSASYNKLKE